MQNLVWIQIDMDADADAAIHKKMFGSGMTTLIISNQSLGKFCLLIKDVTETIQNKATEQKA